MELITLFTYLFTYSYFHAKHAPEPPIFHFAVAHTKMWGDPPPPLPAMLWSGLNILCFSLCDICIDYRLILWLNKGDGWID